MSGHPTILQQFRSFCYRNNATDFEQAIAYFAVFGGMGWKVDLSKPIEKIIEKKLLDNYRYIHGEITTMTQSNRSYHQLLTALATGNRRAHSAFKNANLDRNAGENAIAFLVRSGILKIERPLAVPLDWDEQSSDRLLFVNPFMRFWFSSISPYFKGIKTGDYSEFEQRWANLKPSFSNLVVERLVLETLKQGFNNEPLEKVGSYWDKSVEIDLLAKTESGKQIAGVCHFAKAKASKNELAKLQGDCAKAGLKIDTFIVFSRSKFSNELKKAKGEKLRLLSMRHLRFITENLGPDDLLTSNFKKY